MSRIATRFQELRQAGRKALVPFITAGDPVEAFTVPCMRAMVEAGADIIELGVPFSDPMADGPVIQKASERALAHRMSLRKTLALVAEFRARDQNTPVVLMGYLNPIESMGYRSFVERAAEAGVDGVLTVDMPPEESYELIVLPDAAGIDPIFLLAPNSTEARIRRMGELGKGYLYYVSLKGVTGASHLDLGEVERKIGEIRRLCALPVGVGFGVRDAEIAAAVSQFADAVVVGSALVGRIEQNLNRLDEAQRQVIELLQSMRHAMDRGSVR